MDNKFKIFISSSADKELSASVRFARENNFNLELSRFGLMARLDVEFNDRLEYHKKALGDFENEISVHGFFFDLNPSTPDPEILRLTEHRYNQSFLVAKELKAKTVVFHSGYNSLIKHPDYNRDFLNYQVDFWNYFIKRFEDENITVAIENTYEFTPDIMIKIVDTVNSDCLKLCIDTGHTNINSPLNIKEWIDKFSHRLHHMHIHNNSGNADEHRSLLNGTIDFQDLLNYLNKSKVRPNLVLEIFSKEEILESNSFIFEKTDLALSLKGV